MEFTRFDEDQASERDFEEAAAFLTELSAADRPWLPPTSASELSDLLRKGGSGGTAVRLWFGRDPDGGGRTAAGWLHLPMKDNTGTALIVIRVRPDLRRRGIATDFLRALIPEARAAGRTRLIGQTDSHGPGEAWGATVGLRPKLRFVEQHLTLAESDPARWDHSAPAGYRLRSWTGAAPDELLESYAVARQAIEDAVKGDLRWDEPRWTPERVREEEAGRAAADREFRSVVAVEEATGEVGGITDVLIRAVQPAVAHQGYTAVRRGHRGHGLGLAMKSLLLRELVAERPAIERVTTQTADLEHMAAINRALGFQDRPESVYIAADVEAVETALGSGS